MFSGSRDKTIKAWDVRTGTMVGEFIGHDNWINDLQFHASGKYLLSCSDDKTIRVWDLSNGRNSRTVQSAHSNFVTTIGAHARLLVSGGADNSINIWQS